MRLLIIRHATAVPRGTPDMPDEERPLTKRGERRFRRAADGLARLTKRPDTLLSSPLSRARRTAEIAAKAWGKVEVEESPALAGGSYDEVATALGRFPAESMVAIVGHEPDLSALLGRLLGGAHAERLTFKKGGAALLDVPGSLAEGGTLVWYAPPRILRRLA
ncbi:MAG: phosphohistidine phosphatase SixA [Acidobacteria bacterium]|nr:MAG: phosphohistidine phosphatase SixA [Acidobacteriota bacterium]PYQ20030.1 MAG: phosphohistidine phosphatase SixA [Acidobacteriota bacterium]